MDARGTTARRRHFTPPSRGTQRPFDMLAHDRRRVVGPRAQRGDDRVARLRREPACVRAQRIAGFRPRDCAASFRSRCAGSHCPASAYRTRPHPTRTARRASRDRGRAARRNRRRARPARTCSTGTRAGSRRSRTRDCRSSAAAARGCCLQFDRQVRDAAARVDAVRLDDRTGRAGVDAARAAAAVCARRLGRGVGDVCASVGSGTST